MMTLTEFLLARIAEDEALAGPAQLVVARTGSLLITTLGGEIIATPARVLAECEAKRRIVTEAQDPGDELFVGILAAIYADHPDYQQEWAL